MKQADLDRAVARATGETVSAIKRLGFLLAATHSMFTLTMRMSMVPSSSTGICSRRTAMNETLGGHIMTWPPCDQLRRVSFLIGE